MEVGSARKVGRDLQALDGGRDAELRSLVGGEALRVDVAVPAVVIHASALAVAQPALVLVEVRTRERQRAELVLGDEPHRRSIAHVREEQHVGEGPEGVALDVGATGERVQQIALELELPPRRARPDDDASCALASPLEHVDVVVARDQALENLLGHRVESLTAELAQCDDRRLVRRYEDPRVRPERAGAEALRRESASRSELDEDCVARAAQPAVRELFPAAAVEHEDAGVVRRPREELARAEVEDLLHQLALRERAPQAPAVVELEQLVRDDEAEPAVRGQELKRALQEDDVRVEAAARTREARR